ncbi:hypothetical protein [Halopiger goleimassiliensis]|uniref:hypothetical protein n=1 Tax=Halopiger goleimassiliensis TaxID=1293048 RepID=UPI000677B164|nr:hypothetical protein [Halopiger goleimassiliensis]
MTVDLPDSFADEWEPVTTLTDERSVTLVTLEAATTVYEPAGAATPATGDLPLRSLFVVDLDISPPLSMVGIEPTGVLSMAALKAKDSFVELAEDEGLDVDGVRDTLPFESPSGEPGKWYVLDVTFPLPGDGTDGTAARVDAEAHVVVWPTETSFGVAGGTLPLETVADVSPNRDRDRDRIARLTRTLGDGTGDSSDVDASQGANSPLDSDDG